MDQCLEHQKIQNRDKLVAEIRNKNFIVPNSNHIKFNEYHQPVIANDSFSNFKKLGCSTIPNNLGFSIIDFKKEVNNKVPDSNLFESQFFVNDQNNPQEESETVFHF